MKCFLKGFELAVSQELLGALQPPCPQLKFSVFCKFSTFTHGNHLSCAILPFPTSVSGMPCEIVTVLLESKRGFSKFIH